VFTRTFHRFPSRARRIQSKISHIISLRTIQILSSSRSVGSHSGPFLSGFPTKILYALLITAIHATHPPWFDHPNNIWWSTQVMKIIILQSSPAPPPPLPQIHIFSSVPYSQQLSIHVLPLVWDRPSFTRIKTMYKSLVSYISNFKFLDRLEDKTFWTKW
jgi:hypothetical protein